MSVSFYEVQMDTQVSYGAQGGPTYTTLVVIVPSRSEQRFPMASRAYRKYTINLNDKSLAQMQSLEEFFINMMGKTYGFRMKDWKDYTATNEPVTCINTAGVFTAQLQKTYNTFGRVEVRPITKPQQNLVPVTIKSGGVNLPAAGNWSVDTTTGIITFTSDRTAQVLTWSGQFDVPVRLDIDDMQGTYTDFNILDWETVNLMEIPV